MTRTLSCAAKGKKIRLGGGQDLSLVVERSGTQDEVVQLGWGYQAGRLFDHGEKDEISRLLFAKLDEVIPQISEPAAAEAPAVEPSGVSEVERLADLHSRGSLTDEEFRMAKARVLGDAGSS